MWMQGGERKVLMPSTPFAYSQVVSRTFASFRVVDGSISSGHRNFWSGFDSRQLHHKRPRSEIILRPGFFRVNTASAPSRTPAVDTGMRGVRRVIVTRCYVSPSNGT